MLAAQGTAFCAGAKLGDGADVQDVLVKRSETGQAGHLYIEAVRLFRTAKPIVGAIHGAHLTRCFGPDWSAVIKGRLISVSIAVDNSILAFSAASFKRCKAILSFDRSMP